MAAASYHDDQEGYQSVPRKRKREDLSDYQEEEDEGEEQDDYSSLRAPIPMSAFSSPDPGSKVGGLQGGSSSSRYFGPSLMMSQPRSDVAEQGQRTRLILNYLPQNLSDEELYEVFVKCGAIESLRIMRDKQTGYSFGYGFVNFEDPSSAVLAISKLNGYQVMNKSIKVSYARPPSDDIKDTNLYITNLPRSTTEPDLIRMFESFGKIVQQNVLYDKYTNLPRGVAFVRYNLREEANAAILAMNDFLPEGASECIKVRLAENHGKQKASYVAGFQAGYQKRF